VTGLVKFVGGGNVIEFGNNGSWTSCTCRIILGELFPAVLGKVTKTTLSLFPLNNLSCANIGVELLLHLKTSWRRKLADTRRHNQMNCRKMTWQQKIQANLEACPIPAFPMFWANKCPYC